MLPRAWDNILRDHDCQLHLLYGIHSKAVSGQCLHRWQHNVQTCRLNGSDLLQIRLTELGVLVSNDLYPPTHRNLRVNLAS